jgi:hypothetical protein
MSDEGYTVGTWRGAPNYLCVLCPFATLEQGLMESHLESHRAAQRPTGRFPGPTAVRRLRKDRRRTSEAGRRTSRAARTAPEE